jgi:hypothetical protein
MFPEVWENVKEWTFTFPSDLPTPKSSENDCRGQKPLDWKVSYIIGKFLELKCLKCIRITHLRD